MARIAFVQNLSYAYLGTMYLSALLKRSGHSVDVFIEGGQGLAALAKDIALFNPDIIGFSCTTGAHNWALEAACFFKQDFKKTLIVFGGPHPTFFPEIINEPQVDVVCRGEGEYPLRDLADRLSAGRVYFDIANLWVKTGAGVYKNEVRSLIADLDELPFPDRSIYTKKYPYLNKSQQVFIAGRGCPFSCAYCFNHALKKIYADKGVFVRRRNTAKVIEEISQVKTKGGLRVVYFQDDTFIIDKHYCRELLEEYRQKIGRPFICLLRADLVDEEIVKALKQAGCLNAFFGVETGSEQLRADLLKRNITDAQLEKTAGLLHKYGIKFRTYNMFGLPGEDQAAAMKTVELNIKLKTDYPWSSLLQPFPGTELGEYAKVNNMLDAENCFEPSFFKTSGIKSPDKRIIINLHKLFFFAVKFPFLLPLIKFAIKKDLAGFFDLAFLSGYVWSFKWSEGLSWPEVFQIANANVRNFFFVKKPGRHYTQCKAQSMPAAKHRRP